MPKFDVSRKQLVVAMDHGRALGAVEGLEDPGQVIVRVELAAPRTKHILEVETKMPISPRNAGFDREEYDALVEAVRIGMDRAGADEARIVRG
jgi:hypothetical protein